MTELTLKCTVDPETDYLVCRKCKGLDGSLSNLMIQNEDDSTAIVLTKEDAKALADKLYSIVESV